jgi:hypothetical protein
MLLGKYLLILKILPVTHFKDPKIKMEAAYDKLILAYFPCSQ